MVKETERYIIREALEKVGLDLEEICESNKVAQEYRKFDNVVYIIAFKKKPGKRLACELNDSPSFPYSP